MLLLGLLSHALLRGLLGLGDCGAFGGASSPAGGREHTPPQQVASKRAM